MQLYIIVIIIVGIVFVYSISDLTVTIERDLIVGDIKKIVDMFYFIRVA